MHSAIARVAKPMSESGALEAVGGGTCKGARPRRSLRLRELANGERRQCHQWRKRATEAGTGELQCVKPAELRELRWQRAGEAPQVECVQRLERMHLPELARQRARQLRVARQLQLAQRREHP